MPRHLRWPLLIGFGAVACSPVPSLSPLPPTADEPSSPFRIQAVGTRYTGFPATTGQPTDWRDATLDVSPVPSWLFPGKWSLLPSSSGFGGGVYHQDETGPYPHVSIRRYAGGAFGANGKLPAKYRVSVAVQSFEQLDHMPPIGENGVLVYYRNPMTYAELVISGGNVSVWSSNNATPLGSAGWTGHHWYGKTTNPGDIRRVSAEIDTNSQTLTYWVDGQKAGTVTIPLLTNTTHYTMALRSIGNKMNFGELAIEDLSGGSSPTPTPTQTPTATPTPPPPTTGTPTSFQALGNLPQSAVWLQAAAKNNTVYVSGGSNGSQSFAGVWSSTVQNPWNWQARTTLPTPTEGHGFAIVGNWAYVIGGWSRGSSPRATVYRAPINSDGSLGAWQATASLPQGRAGHALVTDGNRLIVLGGWSPNFTPTSTVWTTTANGDGSLNAWQSLPNMPAVRAFGDACIAGGKLLYVGGSSGSTNVAGVFQASYSGGQLGAWQNGPTLPEALQGHSCLTYGGVATTIGGSTKVYQLLNGAWQAVGTMPSYRNGLAATTSGTQLLALGGQDTSYFISNTIFASSGSGLPAPTPWPTPTPATTPQPTPTASTTPVPSTGFMAVGNLPQGLVWHGAAGKNGQIYVSGGTNGSQSYAGVWSAAAANPGSWQARTALPTPTEGHGFAIVGNWAYAIGGWHRGGAPRATVYRAPINPDGSLGAWQATASLPQGRAFHATVVDGNRLIVLAGWSPSFAPTNTVWTTTANSDGSLNAWQNLPNLPAARAWAGACIAGGKLVLTGGSAGSTTQSTVYQASYSNGVLGGWQSGPSLPLPIEGHGCMNVGGYVTTFGGDDYSSGTPKPTNAIYFLNGGTWQKLNQYPEARFGQALAESDGSLFHLGGHNAQHQVLTSIWKGWK